MLQRHPGRSKKSKRRKNTSPKKIWCRLTKRIKLPSKEKRKRRQWKSKGNKWEAICRKKVGKSSTQSFWKSTVTATHLQKNSRSLQRRKTCWSRPERTQPTERAPLTDESHKLHNRNHRKFWSRKGHKQAQTWPKALTNHHHPSVM